MTDQSSQPKWLRVLYIIGVVLSIIGAVDPLEGSVLIAVGSAVLAFATFRTGDRHRKWFLLFSILIISGVSALFIISAFGGLGDPPYLPYWWGLLFVPYPLGWLATIALLLIRAFRRKK